MSDGRDKLVAALLERAGQFRPLNPGEEVTNPDGSYSTERTHTFPMRGGWVNAPSLWMTDNGPVDLSVMGDDWIAAVAQAYERRTGNVFGRHRSLGPTERAAERRSDAGGAGSGLPMFQRSRGGS